MPESNGNYQTQWLMTESTVKASIQDISDIAYNFIYLHAQNQ
jgi:hypothetical protein